MRPSPRNMYLPYPIRNKSESSMKNGKDAERGTEMSDVHEVHNGSPAGPSGPRPSTSCKPEVCIQARSKYAPPDLRGSPWNKNKSIFLGVILGLLCVWIIVFTTLSQLKII